MDIQLLLDEEDYESVLAQLSEFAEKNDIPMDWSSGDLVKVATTALLGIELSKESFALLVKLVYNIGYRDNHFKSPFIH